MLGLFGQHFYQGFTLAFREIQRKKILIIDHITSAQMTYCLTCRCCWIHMQCWYVCFAVYITKLVCKVAGIQ